MRIKMNSNERKVQLASHYKLPELDKAYSKGKIHVMKLANASNASASSKLQMIEVEPV